MVKKNYFNMMNIEFEKKFESMDEAVEYIREGGKFWVDGNEFNIYRYGIKHIIERPKTRQKCMGTMHCHVDLMGMAAYLIKNPTVKYKKFE